MAPNIVVGSRTNVEYHTKTPKTSTPRIVVGFRHSKHEHPENIPTKAAARKSEKIRDHLDQVNRGNLKPEDRKTPDPDQIYDSGKPDRGRIPYSGTLNLAQISN